MEVFGRKSISSLLSKLLNAAWYGSLVTGALIVILNLAYMFIVIFNINVNMPTVTYHTNYFTYRFNTKYLEVQKPDDIVKNYIEKSLGQDLLYDNKWGIDAFESLYHVPKLKEFWEVVQKNKDKIPSINSPAFSVKFFRNYPYMLLDFYRIKDKPVFIIILFLFTTGTIFIITLVLFNMKKIFSTFSSNDVFERGNYERIRFISFYIFLAELLRVLIFYWLIKDVIQPNIYFGPGLKGSFTPGFEFSWLDINYSLLFAGFIILLISEIFRIGAKIKEENDLTV